MSRSLSVILLIVAISIAFIFYLSSQKPEINYDRFNLVSPGILRTPDDRFENLEDFEDNASQGAQLQTFLKLKEHGQSSRTRALRLKENDIVVAIDGNSFHDSIDNMVDLLSSGEEGDMWLLTIWRNGKFFEVFTRGPLGGIFEFTRPDESQMIMELFQKRDMGRKEEYLIFEALRDVKE